MAIIRAENRLPVRHKQTVTHVLPEIVGIEHVYPARHGGVTKLRHWPRIERRYLIDPYALAPSNRAISVITDPPRLCPMKCSGISANG